MDPVANRSPSRPLLACAREREAETAERTLASSGPKLGPRPLGTNTSQGGSGGSPLPPVTRAFFEARLHHDFGKVRIHSGPDARAATGDAEADAVTVGEDIYIPHELTEPGEDARLPALLAHELAHVAQHVEHDASEVPQARCSSEKMGLGTKPPDEPFTDETGKAAEDGFVLFDVDCAELDPGDKEEVDALMAKHTGKVRIELHGYSSLEGTGDYNRNLSAHRAVALKHYLLDHFPSVVEVDVYAHGATVAFGKDTSGNRRVGIKIADEPAVAAGGAAGAFVGWPGGLLGHIIDLAGAGLGQGADLTIHDDPGHGRGYPAGSPPWPYPQHLELSGFLPDTFTLSQGAWSHDTPPSEAEYQDVLRLARRNYSFFSAILGRTGTLPILHFDANELANLAAASALNTQRSLDTPTPTDISNQSPDTTIVPAGTLKFGEGARKKRRRKKRLQDQ